jgi:tyrosine phenol-lyase
MKTIIEPFKTKVVEPIKFTSKEERQQMLSAAGYNLFKVKAQDVIIDFLTDSGTSALSSEQWAGIMKADESYAGCASFFRFEQSVKDIFGFPIVIPVHQGRAAERLLFAEMVKKGDIVPSNTHFDTTRANIEVLGGQAVDLPCPEAANQQSTLPFKGNIDLAALSKLLEENANRIPFIMLTITNNAMGGQPVSMANLIELNAIARRFQKRLFIDAARFAENAYLIQQREEGMSQHPVRAIVKQIFALADGCLMSAKKDGLSNIGGFLALREEELAVPVRNSLIVTEGFPTYGGLAGRDLETIAIGLWEASDEDYLRYRLASASYLGNGLLANDVPIVTPPGLHAVYLDACRFFPHIDPAELPGQALSCELYLEGGIRACEIGTVMFGHTRKDGLQEPFRQDLVRLALPRRVYSQSHYDYVIEAAANVYKRREKVRGLRIDWEAEHLRHFTARFSPLHKNSTVSAAK